MKIKNMKEQIVKFRDLDNGDVFKCIDSVYVKTEPYIEHGLIIINCISLLDGELVCLDINACVEKVDCELILK